MTAQHELDPALARFVELLEVRLRRGVFTTEPAVRFTFYHALIETLPIMPEDIIHEGEHGKRAKAKIDTRFPSFYGRELALEFKYDRGIPSKKSPAVTQKAGQIFNDLFRLAQLHDAQRVKTIFLYLTDAEMARYLTNASNGLADFFELNVGSCLRIDSEYLSARRSTLRKHAGIVFPCTVHSLRSYTLPKNHYLRIFAVRSDAEQSFSYESERASPSIPRLSA